MAGSTRRNLTALSETVLKYAPRDLELTADEVVKFCGLAKQDVYSTMAYLIKRGDAKRVKRGVYVITKSHLPDPVAARPPRWTSGSNKFHKNRELREALIQVLRPVIETAANLNEMEIEEVCRQVRAVSYVIEHTTPSDSSES
jgi:hypothetical protein